MTAERYALASEMVLGFSGTRSYVTNRQVATFAKLVKDRNVSEFHHGDCKSGDAMAHYAIRRWSPRTKIIIHPCNLRDQRAFLEGDVILPAKAPLVRNRDIVSVSKELVIVPKGYQEELRSGTWATLRYAIKSRPDMEKFVIYPNGLFDIKCNSCILECSWCGWKTAQRSYQLVGRHNLKLPGLTLSCVEQSSTLGCFRKCRPRGRNISDFIVNRVIGRESLVRKHREFL